MKLAKVSKKLIILCFNLVLISCAANEEESASNPASRAGRIPQKEYTLENPGEWKSIALDHIPEIQIDKARSQNNVRVKISGNQFSERHYIEVIGVMDERSHDLDLKYLKRGDQLAVVLSVNLKEQDASKLKVFAKCNVHDLWTIPLEK
jgi:desulfoferrodoxin (superoxide reductase-like protein)